MMPSWKPTTTLVTGLVVLAGVCAGLAWLVLRPSVSTTVEPQVPPRANPLVDFEPLLLRATYNENPSGGSLMAAGIKADLSFRSMQGDRQQPVLRLWPATIGEGTAISVLTDTPLLEHIGLSTGVTNALVQIVELDVDNSSPEVLFSQYTGGPHCCARVTIFREDEHGAWKAIDAGAFDGGNIAATEPVPGYGYVLATYDNRFLYRFVGYATSFPPAQFLALQGNQIIDISDRPHLRPLFEEHAQHLSQDLNQRLASIGSVNGFLAGYAATHARVGRIGEAWPVVLRHYDRNNDWGLEDCPNESYGGDCGEEATRYPNFPSALAALLREGGYVSEDLFLPTSLEIKP